MAILAVVGLAVLVWTAPAQAQVCPAGYAWSPPDGRCVVPSYPQQVAGPALGGEPRRAVDDGPRLGLVIPGAVLLGVGYVAAVITGSILLTMPGQPYPSSPGVSRACQDASGGLDLIPIVGTVIGTTFHAASGDRCPEKLPFMIAGYASAALELAGFTMLLVGLLTGGSGDGYASVPLSDDGPVLSILPAAPGASAGLTARLSF